MGNVRQDKLQMPPRSHPLAFKMPLFGLQTPHATPLFGRSARSRVNAENKKVNLSWCYSWVWWCGKNDRQSSFRSFFFNRWSISPFLGAETSHILVKPGLFFTCFGNLWYLAHLLSLLVFVPPGLGPNNCESMTCWSVDQNLIRNILCCLKIYGPWRACVVRLLCF